MSNKTIKQRIATVAVTALTAGLMTVLAVPSAQARTVAQAEQDTLVLATTTDVDGSPATASTTAADQTFSASGWVADTRASSLTTTGGVYVTGSNTATANVLPGATIAFNATGSDVDTDGLAVVVTGGTLSSLAATSSTSVTWGTNSGLNSSRTVAYLDQSTTATAASKNQIWGLFTVSAAAGSTASISVYRGSAITSTTTATSGTYVGGFTLTVVASNVSGVLSLADSTITQQAGIANATTGTSGTNAFNTTSTLRNGFVGVIYLDLNDAYAANILSGTVTATSSAGLIIGSETTTTGSIVNSASQSFSTLNDTTDGVMWFYAKQPTAHVAGSTTVTITYNGSVIGTHTIRWTGDVASLVVDPTNSCATLAVNQADTSEGNVGDACVVYVAKDAAGNTVTYPTNPTVDTATGALIGASASTTTTDSYTSSYNMTMNTTYGYGFTTLVVPNNALSGDGSYILKLTNAQGVGIKSQEVKVKVSRGSTNSFTASWDKASYKFGDIATLTIGLKDAYGNNMATGTTLGSLGTLVLDVNSSGFASTGTACSGTSTVTNGTKTCKYSVLNTEGAFAYNVDVVTATPQDPIFGTIQISPSVTSVSNADVLKSIVALIASINKQIQALQKLILKR